MFRRTYKFLPEELVIFLDNFFADYRHRYELIGEIQKSENAVAFQYRMSLLDTNKKAQHPLPTMVRSS